MNLVTMKVKLKDLEKLRTRCKEIYIKEHPDLQGRNIANHELFGEVVNFYENPD